jgi:hypothetical protein
MTELFLKQLDKAGQHGLSAEEIAEIMGLTDKSSLDRFILEGLRNGQLCLTEGRGSVPRGRAILRKKNERSLSQMGRHLSAKQG